MAFKPGDQGHLAEHDRIKAELIAHGTELAGRLSEGELSATIAGRAASVAGGVRVVPLGDSTTIADSDTTPSWGKRDFWAWAHVLSGGAFKYVRNAGVSGDKSADMLARFDTDVAPYSPNVVPLVAGINDAVNGTIATETYISNVKAIVAKIRNIGAQPWLGTVAPNLNTGGVQRRIATYNAFLRQYSAAEGIPLIPINAILTNPADGKYLPAYNYDGTHQSEAGAAAIGQAIADMVAVFLPKWSPDLPTHNTPDTLSLVTNGLFLSGAPVGTGWINTGGTPSIVTDPTIKGNWQRLTDNGVATSNVRENFSLGGAVAGDVLNVTGRYRQVMGTSQGSALLFLSCVGSTQVSYILRESTADIDGAFSVDFTLPAGTTSFQVQMARVCTVAGNGYSQIAQVATRNLTQLGVLDAE